MGEVQIVAFREIEKLYITESKCEEVKLLDMFCDTEEINCGGVCENINWQEQWCEEAENYPSCEHFLLPGSK